MSNDAQIGVNEQKETKNEKAQIKRQKKEIIKQENQVKSDTQASMNLKEKSMVK